MTELLEDLDQKRQFNNNEAERGAAESGTN